MVLLHTLLAPRWSDTDTVHSWTLKIVSLNVIVFSLYLLCQSFHSMVMFIHLFLGKKYDLEFKSTKKSGQNFKSADDMIEIYSQLCSGINEFVVDLSFLTSLSFIKLKKLFKFADLVLYFCTRVPTCLHWAAFWQRWLGALKEVDHTRAVPGDFCYFDLLYCFYFMKSSWYEMFIGCRGWLIDVRSWTD